ncbi:hypothetical protein PFFCH_03919 [Plasmodium falciparum FCH/4]|uniref:Uncharacterized protein n=1 Tax=Plasmodium falciparum FCH/4 TaxID=1036724 RepID=A0A024VJT7_PLAFA|nr:hypothetical protein PFFCH_03919 [Plasmodium falciparum FCH/4]
MVFPFLSLFLFFTSAKINTVQLDLSSYESIEKCANNILRKFPKIDIIVNNAGTLNQTLEYINGLEHTFFVNYFGHFYLINLLYKRILACDTLVINMSSIAHAMLNEKDVKYDFIFESKSKTDTNSNLLYRREYNFSKLCMLYYTQQLQIRHHLTVHHKIYEYLTNGIIITTFYFMLRKKNVGGTVKDVLKNKNKLRGKVVIITG